MNDLQTTNGGGVPSVFDNYEVFEQTLKMATTLSESTLIPEAFQKKPASCLIALDLARRLKMNVLALFPHLYVIDNKPAFSTQFMITIVNTSGIFDRIEWATGTDKEIDVTFTDWCNGKRETKRGKLPNVWAVASMRERRTGKTFTSQRVDVAFAEANGWVGKPGSKWRTMPEQMARYRAASILIRSTCPELLLGINTAEDVEYRVTTTIDVETIDSAEDVARLVERFNEANSEAELKAIAADVKIANVSEEDRRTLGDEYKRRRDEIRRQNVDAFKIAIGEIADDSDLSKVWPTIVEQYERGELDQQSYEELKRTVEDKRRDQTQRANLKTLEHELTKSNDKAAIEKIADDAQDLHKHGLITQPQLIGFLSKCDKRAVALSK